MIIAYLFFTLYAVVAAVVIFFAVFSMSQALQFNFMSARTKRIGVTIGIITIGLMIAGVVALLAVDWSVLP